MNQLLLNQLKQNSVAVYVWKVHFTSSTYVSILKWLVFFIKFISWEEIAYMLKILRKAELHVCVLGDSAQGNGWQANMVNHYY